ncbi:MAG: hypothetical protein C5B50_14665 [Verrucomicrobia bacterium]|nr:MAG: hypothetical protein C5B50_14665 [Verrucomicrobiota bacterium]
MACVSKVCVITEHFYFGMRFTPPSNGMYRLDYTPAMANPATWTALTNVYLNAPYTYYDPATNGQRYYQAVLQP